MDYVKYIEGSGEFYPVYRDWIENYASEYLGYYTENSYPNPKSLFRVLFTAGHLTVHDEIIHLIEDLNDCSVHLVGVDGVRTATVAEMHEFFLFKRSIMVVYTNGLNKFRYEFFPLHDDEVHIEEKANILINDLNEESGSSFKLVGYKEISLRHWDMTKKEKRRLI